MRDEVLNLPADTDITITTADHTVTFSFTGYDITIKAWGPA